MRFYLQLYVLYREASKSAPNIPYQLWTDAKPAEEFELLFQTIFTTHFYKLEQLVAKVKCVFIYGECSKGYDVQ